MKLTPDVNCMVDALCAINAPPQEQGEATRFLSAALKHLHPAERRIDEVFVAYNKAIELAEGV